MNCHPCTGRIGYSFSRNQIHHKPKLHGASLSRWRLNPGDEDDCDAENTPPRGNESRQQSMD